MDEIVERYKQGKFQKCLELIKVLPRSDNIVDGFIVDNCILVCESLGAILEKDLDKMCKTQECLYLFFDKVTSVGMITEEIPLQLKLTATFNFIWWILFYVDNVDNEMNDGETDQYLEIINKGILRGKISTSLTYADTSEDILLNLYKLKNMIPQADYKTSLLILELTTVIILYILKLKKSLVKKCLDVISAFVVNLKKEVESLESLDRFVEPKSVSLVLFKFGLDKITSLVSELDFKIVDYIYLLESALLFSLRDFKGSLKSLQKNVTCRTKSLWNYIGALSSFEIEEWNLCLGFVNKASLSVDCQENLKARLSVMYGKLCWVDRNYKKSLKHFGNALSLLPKSAVIYYYIGQEYGKMGLYDLMVENFKKLLEIVRLEEFDDDFTPDFESTILEWFHPPDEITHTEALYALSVAYGLNEKFNEATETFEKVIKSPDINNLETEKGVIEMPDVLTILHEASVMNLLTGNLVRAEQIAVDAVERYTPKDLPRKEHERTSSMAKDVEWLERTIQQELLENDLEPKEFKKEIVYSEKLVYFLPENVVALLILSEIQRIQERDDYKATLGKVLSIFSKYLSSMHKKEALNDDESHALTLVKGLAGKTCLKIAEMKMKEKDMTNIEKMFKRCLSCNKGDKDALFNYYTYLTKEGRSREARNLWLTFHKEESTILEECLQSFSLRYFFNSTLSKRDFEKISKNIQLMNLDTS